MRCDPARFAGLMIGVLLVVPQPRLVAQAPKLQPSALRQIEALVAEKASRTSAQRKIASQLLLEHKRRKRDALFRAAPDLRPRVLVASDGSVLVDIRAEVGPALLERIARLGGSVSNSSERYGAIRARLPLAALEPLAAGDDVRSIRPAARYELHKVDTSEGDVAHAAAAARSTFGVDGTGVQVGVISDSVEELATLQASGDLPGGVTVLSGQAGSGTSEGTAMLEIVHDLAPGADLFFATAQGGEAQLAQNILDLQAAGCDVIVDAVRYLTEPVFQDGVVADAVDQVVAFGVAYFSSAGDSGNLDDGTAGVWEGDFSPVPPPPVLDILSFEAADFGGGANLNVITADSPSRFTLHWSDPQGGSGNDYDLHLLDPTGSTIYASSSDTQNGNDDPYESIDSTGLDDTGNTLVIIGFGADPRFLHLSTNGGGLTHATAGATSGHNSAAGAISVAAVDQATAMGGAFTGGPSNPVEPFSSDGPRRVFFQHDGTPYTPGNFSSTGGELRQKPDIAAADGVSTATPGFDPFFGTSAAAPHAAALAALLLEDQPGMTPADLRTTFEATALDIETPGVDRDSGAGIVMADLILSALSLVGDRVWQDFDLDGIQDATEPGQPGVVVHLLDGLGTVLETTVTDASGRYAFVNLSAATYRVRFDLPPGMSFAPQDQGADDALDSDADPGSGETVDIVLGTDVLDLRWDAGLDVGLIFLDGFESGDTAMWSRVGP